MIAFLHTKEKKVNGVGYECYLTQELPVKITECPKNPYVTGYGARIPTQYMVLHNGRWKRVYCICYSNSGTLYIGKTYTNLAIINIQDF